MTTLNARDLSLNDVQRLFKLEEQFSSSFTPLLSLEPLTDAEQQEFWQIRNDFRRYLTAGKVSEGQVKLLALAPLLRLAGFYRSPIQITLEEDIAEINIADEDTIIKGRFDILAVSLAQKTAADAFFWVLVIEAKNSSVAPSAGLAQLLTYAYKSLERQTSVWGLATNGELYQFVCVQQGNPPTYQLMPVLSLFEPERSIQILQVLKAICKQ
ncbi:hypothetical protein [Kamptonema formosum]|uniref:hypothetical protein n=1 Tax=Kamptonema formosum TaxID=331992 RepID=UPI000348BB0A|nr:hypothetical protein [Oscillatoria sp. PCC 10802]